jgi:hypothetical protein
MRQEQFPARPVLYFEFFSAAWAAQAAVTARKHLENHEARVVIVMYLS